jgi:hypothetical protein
VIELNRRGKINKERTNEREKTQGKQYAKTTLNYSAYRGRSEEDEDEDEDEEGIGGGVC